MSQNDHEPDQTFLKRLIWFIALWLFGVAGTALLVLPFHLLIAAAMHH